MVFLLVFKQFSVVVFLVVKTKKQDFVVYVGESFTFCFVDAPVHDLAYSTGTARVALETRLVPSRKQKMSTLPNVHFCLPACEQQSPRRDVAPN